MKGVSTVETIVPSAYRGRLAPSPTGYLHIGHARTFWMAQKRALVAGGRLILRDDDLDFQRCKQIYKDAMIQDLRWFGFQWQEGPDIGGEFGPYSQSQRHSKYVEALKALQATGHIYPCTCSRKDIQSSASAPHAFDDEPIYPGTCRERKWPDVAGRNHCWRFRVPEGAEVSFVDGQFGLVRFVAGKDFGDFVVWRPDQVASYQLATVVDDAAMRITEVVRGADLLISTARQMLLFHELNLPVPAYRHCELMTDASGVRLAKRSDSFSLRHLRQQGMTPEEVRKKFFHVPN